MKNVGKRNENLDGKTFYLQFKTKRNTGIVNNHRREQNLLMDPIYFQLQIEFILKYLQSVLLVFKQWLAMTAQ